MIAAIIYINTFLIFICIVRLITMVSKTSSGVPNSHGNAILAKIQDAYDEATSAGISFIGLCSLIDRKMSGKIAKSELIHTFKMMSCIISNEELDSLSEVLPDDVISTSGTINYINLNHLLQGHTPRTNLQRGAFGMMEVSPAGNMTTTRKQFRQTGALPSYATPYSTTRGSAAMYGARGAINTPLGIPITVPMKQQMSLSSVAYKNMMEKLWIQIERAIEENTIGWKGRFVLSKQLAAYDIDNSGFVSIDTFQVTLEELGVSLTAVDINAVVSLFGHPETDSIDYEEFCSSMDSFLGQRESSNAPSLAASWITPRIIDRFRIARREGQNPRDLFDILDIDRTGLVCSQRFLLLKLLIMFLIIG